MTGLKINHIFCASLHFNTIFAQLNHNRAIFNDGRKCHGRKNLTLEAARVTEIAALAASRWIGRGDEKSVDQAAVDAMRTALNGLDICGTVVIGEGERDQAPMLYIGEEVGSRVGRDIDIALDPLEGTTITAKGG